jgi:hypothetical protein
MVYYEDTINIKEKSRKNMKIKIKDEPVLTSSEVEAMSFDEQLAYIKRFFQNQNQLATALGISSSQVITWGYTKKFPSLLMIRLQKVTGNRINASDFLNNIADRRNKNED